VFVLVSGCWSYLAYLSRITVEFARRCTRVVVAGSRLGLVQAILACLKGDLCENLDANFREFDFFYSLR
jgi:hypothetical protein